MQKDSLIKDHFRLISRQKMALKKLGLKTIHDLLYHFPTRYGDTSETRNISSLKQGDIAVIFGKISKLKTSKGFRTKIPMADAWVEDESGKIHCVWFNQPYIAKMTPEGALVRIEGKVSQRRKKVKSEQKDLTHIDDGVTVHEPSGELYFSNPKLEIINKLPIGVGDSLFGDDGKAHTLYPIYPESRGITSNWFYHKITDIFKSGLLDNLTDPIPDEILKKYNLPSLKTALIWIHTPMKKNDAETARKRFAFEEVFFIQLEKQIARKEYEKNPSFIIDVNKNGIGNSRIKGTININISEGEKNVINKNSVYEFIKRFPFEATEAQKNSVNIILEDFKKNHAMSRLLEGDVGSGKTAVAAATAFAVVTTKPTVNGIEQKYGNLEVAYMCPTEILAIQHFESFIKYFAYLGIQIGLITGSGCRKFPSKLNPKGWTDISRTQLLKWVANGEIPILIGTHSLIQKSVKFKNLAYVIIDEQHRFGLKQRASLVQKELLGLVEKEVMETEKKMERVPHLLSMTATPIPRTLALTIYGDLDLTLLDQMPHGRKPIITDIVLPTHRDETYEKIRIELKAGRQAYIICPRIDEPDPLKEMALNVKSVKEEAKRLKAKIFPEYEIGILHSKMKSIEKEKIMMDFKNGKINILVATSVVEVGVNVENATIIIIEGAERFGLAQLHQLRGRVIRSNHQAYCYIFASSNSAKTFNRLTSLKKAKNGFELAEYDLKFRGAGELSGARQWGISDIAMEALKNIKMVEAARTEAQLLISRNISLENYPQIKNNLKDRQSEVRHWE